jgi:hypothetical protein
LSARGELERNALNGEVIVGGLECVSSHGRFFFLLVVFLSFNC